jgi:hypothetical protein
MPVFAWSQGGGGGGGGQGRAPGRGRGRGGVRRRPRRILSLPGLRIQGTAPAGSSLF